MVGEEVMKLSGDEMMNRSRPGFRLRQTPIDKWSIREKLALASSVHRSGDQNWYSVSRSLKCFAESNRPNDWFSQKNCALQYSELLENVETPKRKRGERGESTAQDLIVSELQQKRIEELTELVIAEKKERDEALEELEFFKSGKAGPEKFHEVWERMKKEEKDREIAEEEHKKWLIEREAKIAQMKANRHAALVRSPKSAKSIQITSPNESDTKIRSDTLDKPPEPLTLKIEPSSTDTDNSQSATPQTPTSASSMSLALQTSLTPQLLQQTPEKKITTSSVISSPSTSPLLTHLLQSPSPSASGTVPYNILSPSHPQQKTSPSSTHFFPSNITSPTMPRRPITPQSSNQSIEPSSTEENRSPIKELTTESFSSAAGTSSPSAVSASPTLSKLLESSPPLVKETTATTKETEASVIISRDIEMDDVTQIIIADAAETLQSTSELQIEEDNIKPVNEANPDNTSALMALMSETNEPVQVEETIHSTETDSKPLSTSIAKTPSETIPPSQATSVTSTKESEIFSQDNSNLKAQPISDDQLSVEIKQEIIEPRESVIEIPMDIDQLPPISKVETRAEPQEVQPLTPIVSKVLVIDTPGATDSTTPASSRKRKRPPPVSATPPTAPTRRSNRVRTIKDKTGSEEEPILLEEPGSAAINPLISTSTTTPTLTPTTASATIFTSTIATNSATLPTTSISSIPLIDSSVTAAVVSAAASVVAAASSTPSKKTSNSNTPSTLPPPPPPPSMSTENSAGEESTDNTNITLPHSLIKTPASTLSTAPTSKASSITESAPNSPASALLTPEEIENQKEYKAWKKSIMLLWRQAATHKFSTLFAHPVTDSEAKGYSTVVYRPIDLLTIRKKIENGSIKTTAEFQRDMMLMFQNAIMYNSVDHDVHQMAVEMQKEILEGIEDYIETQQKSSSPTNEPTKPRGRRSNVSTSSDAHEPVESAELRRRKRISTDTEPATTTAAPTAGATSTTAAPAAVAATSTPVSTSKSKTKKKPSN